MMDLAGPDFRSQAVAVAPAATAAAPYASQKVTKISEKFPMLCKTDSSEKGVLLLLLLSLLPAEYSSTDGIIITQQQLLLSAIRYCQTYLQGHPPHMTVTTHVSMFELEGVELGSLGLKSLISRESSSRRSSSSSRVPYVKMGTNPASSAPIAMAVILVSIVQNWRDFWLCFMHCCTYAHNMLSAFLHTLASTKFDDD